jgi:hypothetical protein
LVVQVFARFVDIVLDTPCQRARSRPIRAPSCLTQTCRALLLFDSVRRFPIPIHVRG